MLDMSSQINTSLYSETIKDQIAVAANSEMEYLGVMQRLSSKIRRTCRHTKTNGCDLVPYSMSKGRSYYTMKTTK